MNTLSTVPSQAEIEPNWELLAKAVDYMNGECSADFIELMSYLTDEDLNACSLNFQRRLWEQMVIADHEDALNYRVSYMHKPFGMAILQKIALEDPKLIIEEAEEYPESVTFQRLLNYLKRELGPQKIQEIIAERENTVFRRLYRKLFGENQPKAQKG